MQRTNIYLDEAQIAALDSVAEARGVSRAEVVREFVARGLAATPESMADDLAAIEASFGALADAELDPLERSDDERAAHLERIRAS